MIHVIICDEGGNPIGDGVDLESNVFPSTEDDRFCFLRFVDPYGDTVFNRLQLPILSNDLRLLKTHSQDDQSRTKIGRIEDLLDRCGREVHTYVKFFGD